LFSFPRRFAHKHAMSTRAEIAKQIIDSGIVAVVRTAAFEDVAPVCDALAAGGVIGLEITMTVPDALRAIRETSARFSSRALVGAGTVLTTDQGRAVVDAGAQFVVSPITRTELIRIAHAADKPVMIGAYTPTEAQLAHEAGADFIKIFPADKLGPGYIKNIRAPLPHLRIVPTGGVDLQTAPEFLRAGCAALGVGSSLLNAELIKGKRWAELTKLASEFVRVVREARAR
jgi:2-dehydro-3-deoxyphosphogluconate aldolase / (4S)-4-hydroxy-2-oxoglutarate aldolase